MYCYKDDAYNALEKLTGNGGLTDHSNKRMLR